MSYINIDMSLAQEFDTPVSNADFLSADWRPEHCDPTVWEEPSTHGIDNVELVDTPHMRFWLDTSSWNNPGRKKFKQSNVIHFADLIATKGIIPSRVVYYDVDTMETINGAHRRGASAIRNIPGWMHQGVKFTGTDAQKLLAKIRFANASNHVVGLYNNEPTKDDVKVAVAASLKLIGEYDKSVIREEVRIQGPGLTDKQKDDIVNSLYSDCMFDENMKPSSRYRDLNNNNVETLLKEIRDNHSDTEPWVVKYWDNDDEITICINAANFESRVGAVTTVAAKASMADKPLHIIFTVPIPVGKETLNSKRDKFFSMHLQSLEDRILNIQGKALSDKNRRDFPWNHSDCQHRTVAQDTENESTIPLIKVKNRNFN
jgi:hypothetical protein